MKLIKLLIEKKNKNYSLINESKKDKEGHNLISINSKNKYK